MMKLTMDANAVRTLIGTDEEFALELRRAVVAEIVRNTILKDAGLALQLIEPAVHKAIISAGSEISYVRRRMDEELNKLVVYKDGMYSRANFVPTKETEAKLKKSFEPLIAEALAKVSSETESRMSEAVNKAVQRIEENLDGYVQRRVDAHITAEVDRRVAAKLSEVLKAIPA